MTSKVAGANQGKTAVAVQAPALIAGIFAVSMVAVGRPLLINGEAA